MLSTAQYSLTLQNRGLKHHSFHFNSNHTQIVWRTLENAKSGVMGKKWSRMQEHALSTTMLAESIERMIYRMESWPCTLIVVCLELLDHMLCSQRTSKYMQFTGACLDGRISSWRFDQYILARRFCLWGEAVTNHRYGNVIQAGVLENVNAEFTEYS